MRALRSVIQVNSGLEQECACLPAVVCLMVEEVLEQEAEVLCLLLPSSVAVAQRSRQMLRGDKARKLGDHGVDPCAKLTKFR